ncbi:uncharacterized protein AMSG_10044 [Thecamonas trahens ATCC 50062]|uniref:DUF3456 domain-containing protein n=1 Tax=Thecamonas trahens ATCC 50062 TaxID=461836 RepID=A0A0L0DS29_THETB|nr:hypothetical protein AMSG_10044 [Thecamonas trahens ATCC 50062]KNC54248.1 hypothetical protein AMSG_10044 [Thecamonas trahens ATCC 50062]|eukprot:XP_013753883.1 hypothetical protein AMSG_10044 [Thecamonas trahens ATCC 50062]
MTGRVAAAQVWQTVWLSLVVAAVVASAVVGTAQARLPQAQRCSGCEVVAGALAGWLFDDPPATTIEVGSALNDPTSYSKVAYASSELRVMEAVEGVCGAVHRGSVAVVWTYNRAELTNRTTLSAEANSTSALPGVPNVAKALRDECHIMVDAHEDAIVQAFYAHYDSWIEARDDAVRAVGGGSRRG